MTSSSPTRVSPLTELIGTVDRLPARTLAAADAIVVDHLTKTYRDGIEAVRGITLRVASGEAYGVLGPNGAGKSTTIGMLGTLVRPTGGSAEVAGMDVTLKPREVRRRVGFAMQQAGVDDFATARELLVLQARLYGVPRPEATRRAGLLLRVMELDEVEGRRLATLSGGLKRRVDLAASLIHLPRILFLEGPTEGLDPRSRADVWATLEELRRLLGLTIVLTTHYMKEADRLCDRIGIIDRGRLVTEGTPEALKATVGSQALVIRFSAETDIQELARAEQALMAHGNPRQVQVADRELSIFVDDAAAMAPQALRALERAGLASRSIAITQPTLEDVYLRHTGRTLTTTAEADNDELRRAA